MIPIPVVYTVSRCRETKNPDRTVDFYGPVHGSRDAIETVCGQKIDGGNWYILTNCFDGEVTCKKCNKIIKEGVK